MRVSVKLHGILRDYYPPGFKGSAMQYDLENGITVLALAEHIGIPENELYAAFLNDKPIQFDTPLIDEGFLRLFPPVVGG